MEVLEFDDLRVRVDAVTDAQVDERMALARDVFELDDSVAGRGLPVGGARSRSASTGSSTTSGWTASPTTTAAWRANSTNGSARA